MTDLDRRLLAAHAAHDGAALVDLYLEAADASTDPDAQAFYLTHAHVFALEIGHPGTGALRQRLIDAGRETTLHPAGPPKR